MPQPYPDLEALFRQVVGRGEVFVGDLTTIDGVAPLGIMEGQIQLAWNHSFNELQYQEYTGDLPHRVFYRGPAPVISGTITVHNFSIFEQLSPIASLAHGDKQEIEATYTSVAVISGHELRDAEEATAGAGLGYDGTAWDPEAPTNIMVLPKAVLSVGSVSFNPDDGNKATAPLELRAVYEPDLDVGLRAVILGDPVAAGWEEFRL